MSALNVVLGLAAFAGLLVTVSGLSYCLTMLGFKVWGS